MPLAHRVIPTILCNGRKLVKGQKFNAWRTVGVASQAARVHAMRGVDEVVLLDIGATPEGRGPDLALVEELAEKFFVPLAVGGGIRTLQQVRDLLCAGADKVVLGSVLAEDPRLLQECSYKLGAQALVAAIDVRGSYCTTRNASTLWPLNPTNAAEHVVACGAGEILLTNVEREGTMQGYDLDLIRRVRAVVKVPLVAHGGCGTYQHMVEAVEAGANAVAAGALFQFTDATPRAAAAYLQEHGIEARV